MTTKEKVQDLLARLPDDCSLEDVLYHLYVIQAIEKGLEDVAAGRTIPHEEVVEQLRRKWVLGAALLIRERGEAGLLDEPTPTDFDEPEWEW